MEHEEEGPLLSAAEHAREARLVESEQRLRSLFENVLDGFALHEIVRDASGEPVDYRFLEANPAFEQLTGLRAGGILGRTAREVLPDLEDEWLSTYAEVVRTGDPATFERTAQALGRTYAVRAFRVGPDRFATVFSDVTARRRGEEALRSSEERFRIVAGETGLLIYDYDVPSGRITWAGAIQEVLFLEEGESSGFGIEDWGEAIHPDDRRRVLAALEKGLSDGRPFRQEYRFLRADGTVIDVEDRGSFLRDGRSRPFRMLGAMRDVTAEKAAREELFRSRQMLRAVLDHVPQRVFWKDRESRYLGGNRRFADDVGLVRAEELVGRTDFDLYPREDAERYRAEDIKAMESGTPVHGEDEAMVLPAGETRWIRTSKLPLRDRDGQVIGVLGTYDDITERKLAQGELRAANEQLQAQVKELERRSRELSILAEMGDHFQACRTRDEAHAVAARLLPRLLPAQSGRLHVNRPNDQALVLAAAWGEALDDSSVPGPDDCWALRRGRIHGSGGSGGVPCGHLPRDRELQALCVPLLSQGELFGLLTVATGGDADVPPDESLCVSVAEHVALALANLQLTERLRHQAEHDPLTGLYNRRHLDATLPRELHRAARSRSPVSLVIADIDRFKDYNDRFGHEAGDAVLRAIGAFLSSHVRAGDVACRFGGEEFVLLLPDTVADDALRRAEELRREVRCVDPRSADAGLPPLSLSLGVAQFPRHAATPAALFRAADAALYQAKAAGRDRVAVAPDGPVGNSGTT